GNAVEHVGAQHVGAEAHGGGLLGPPVAQPAGIDTVLLGGTGLEGGELAGGGTVPAQLGGGRVDVGGAGRERPHRVVVDAGDVGQPTLDRFPFDAETPGQLVTELGGGEIARGTRVEEQSAGVEGP